MKLVEILPETGGAPPAPFPDGPLPDPEPRDSEQDGLDIGSRQVNVGGGRKYHGRGENYKKARRIQAFAKRQSKETDRAKHTTDTPSGWRADPHQGSYSSNWRTQT